MERIIAVVIAALLVSIAQSPCAAQEAAVLKGDEIERSNLEVGWRVEVTYTSQKGRMETAKGPIRAVGDDALTVMDRWSRRIKYGDIVTLRVEHTGQGRPALLAEPGGLQVGEKFVVKLRDGGQIVGELKSETADELILLTSFGEVKVACSKISDLTRIAPEDIRKGEYWHPDPNRTRSFVFPTASTLPRGKGFYENYYLVFNSIHYGATERMMVSLGIVPIPGAMIFTFGPKFQVHQNRTKTVEAAVGGQVFVGTDGDDSAALFVPYGVLSLGRSGGRLNIGAGGIVVEGEKAFLLNLGSDIQVSRRMKLMGEVFALSAGDEHHILPIYGLRFFSGKLAFDLGFWNIPDEEDLTLLGTPLVNFVFGF